MGGDPGAGDRWRPGRRWASLARVPSGRRGRRRRRAVLAQAERRRRRRATPRGRPSWPTRPRRRTDEALDEIEALAGRRAYARCRGRPGWTTTADWAAGRAARRRASGRTSTSPSAPARPWSFTTGTRTTTCCGCSWPGGAPERWCFHCFSGDAEMAKLSARPGYVMSFAGTVTSRTRATCVRRPGRAAGAQMLVETDAPYLTPMPYRGRPNAPYLVPLTVRCLAKVKNIDLGELCATISRTGERVFGPW